ncbi:hypothetical protein D3C71_2171300 [compost metagenome]
MQNARIESATAAGAAFKQHMREVHREFLHYPVESQHIAVGGFALALGRQSG